MSYLYIVVISKGLFCLLRAINVAKFKHLTGTCHLLLT